MAVVRNNLRREIPECSFIIFTLLTYLEIAEKNRVTNVFSVC